MRYDDYIALFDQATTNLKGRAFFGKGTLNEMNTGTRRYPLVWVVTPMLVTNQFAGASAEFFNEGYNVRLRVVTSASLVTTEDEATVMYNENKIIADAIVQQFRDTEDLEIQNYSLNQIFKAQDDVHIGWEATFTLVSYVAQDECCSLAERLVIPDPGGCSDTVENLCNVTDDGGTVLIRDNETGEWHITSAPWVTSVNGQTGIVSIGLQSVTDVGNTTTNAIETGRIKATGPVNDSTNYALETYRLNGEEIMMVRCDGRVAWRGNSSAISFPRDFTFHGAALTGITMGLLWPIVSGSGMLRLSCKKYRRKRIIPTIAITQSYLWLKTCSGSL